MGVTRRRFIEMGTLGAVSTAVALEGVSQLTPALLGAASPNQKQSGSGALLANATADTFLPWVGSTFDVYSKSPRPALFVLVEVKNSSSPSGTASKPCFSLRFQALSGDSLPQGTYTFKHSVLGSFELLVVPSGPGMQPMYYTAIINHSAP